MQIFVIIMHNFVYVQFVVLLLCFVVMIYGMPSEDCDNIRQYCAHSSLNMVSFAPLCERHCLHAVNRSARVDHAAKRAEMGHAGIKRAKIWLLCKPSQSLASSHRMLCTSNLPKQVSRRVETMSHGKVYLGSCIRPDHINNLFVEGKVESWSAELEVLATTAIKLIHFLSTEPSICLFHTKLKLLQVISAIL